MELPYPLPDTLTSELITKDDPCSCTNNLKVGDKYKITGGKFKKYKECVLVKLNPTYSDVSIGPSLATGELVLNVLVDTFVAKVKNCYLLAMQPQVVIEMPTADDLVVVQEFPEEPDGTLEINELGEEVDNITDTLPTITEALKLRQDHLKTLGQMLALQQKHDEYKYKFEEIMKYNDHLQNEMNLVFQCAFSCCPTTEYDGKIDELLAQVKPSDWKQKYDDLLQNRSGSFFYKNQWKINAIKKILE